MARKKKKKRSLSRLYGQSVEERYAEFAEKGEEGQDYAAKRHRGKEAFDRHAAEDDYGDEELRNLALTRFEQFPVDMRKYWIHRHWLFSLFDGSSASGDVPLLDRESWYSVTPEPIAARIAQRCRSGTVLDAFCGVGGNAIQFAMTCEHVIAIDIDPVKVRMAQHNARIYGVEAYVTFLQGDWRDFARDWVAAQQRQNEEGVGGDDEDDDVDAQVESSWQGCERMKIDCVFLSPPWGGVDYRSLHTSSSTSLDDDETSIASSSALIEKGFYPLAALAPSGGTALFQLASQITPNICMFLPRTVDLNEILELAKSTTKDPASDEDGLLVDVEEHWLEDRCKAVTCFFGELRAWIEPEEEHE